MRDIFPGFYRPTDSEFKKLWDEALVVLDTNVLLNLYRYRKETRDEFLKILERIADRLWIPYQVGMEFQEDRPHAIAEQVRKYGEFRTIVEDAEASLRSKLTQLQLDKRHPYISHEKLLESISTAIREFVGELVTLEKTQPDLLSNDEIRAQIDELLRGRVGEPSTQKELDSFVEEGKQRYSLKQPPGYLDSKKEGAYTYNGLVSQREFGDLIIWKQILKQAADSTLRYLLFITDDDKSDWWWVVEPKGRRNLGPRPELIAEIKSAGADLFYMYSSEKFVEYGSKALGIQVNDQTIPEVRGVAEETRRRRPYSVHAAIRFRSIAAKAVIEYLRATYPSSIWRTSPLATERDILESRNDGTQVFWKVTAIALWTVEGFQKAISRLRADAGEAAPRRCVSVFACNSEHRVERTETAIAALEDVPSNLSFIVGLVNFDPEGKPFFVERARLFTPLRS